MTTEERKQWRAMLLATMDRLDPMEWELLTPIMAAVLLEKDSWILLRLVHRQARKRLSGTDTSVENLEDEMIRLFKQIGVGLEKKE